MRVTQVFRLFHLVIIKFFLDCGISEVYVQLILSVLAFNYEFFFDIVVVWCCVDTLESLLRLIFFSLQLGYLRSGKRQKYTQNFCTLPRNFFKVLKAGIDLDFKRQWQRTMVWLLQTHPKLFLEPLCVVGSFIVGMKRRRLSYKLIKYEDQPNN